MNSRSISGLGAYGIYESPQRAMKASQSGTVQQQRNQDKIRSPLQYAGGMISSNVVPISNYNSVARDSQRIHKQTNSLPAFRDQQLLLLEKPKNQLPMQERVKQIMPILTMRRLRKMQALIRGFLTRRITYPPLLRQHRLCEAVYHSIRRRVTDKLVTEVALEVITFNKYNDNLSLYSPDSTAVASIADSIVDKIITGISRDVVTTAVAEMASNLLPVRATLSPQVTFNLSDPAQLLLYDMLLREISLVRRPIAQEAIFEIVEEIRLETQIKEFFLDGIMEGIYREVVNETIQQQAAHQIAEGLIQTQVGEATQAIVYYQYEKALQPLQRQAEKELDRNFLLLLVGEALLQSIVEEPAIQPPSPAS